MRVEFHIDRDIYTVMGDLDYLWFKIQSAIDLEPHFHVCGSFSSIEITAVTESWWIDSYEGRGYTKSNTEAAWMILALIYAGAAGDL